MLSELLKGSLLTVSNIANVVPGMSHITHEDITWDGCYIWISHVISKTSSLTWCFKRWLEFWNTNFTWIYVSVPCFLFGTNDLVCLLILNIFFLTIKMQIVVMTCKLVISVANYDFSASWWFQWQRLKALPCVSFLVKRKMPMWWTHTLRLKRICFYFEAHVLRFPMLLIEPWKSSVNCGQFSDISLTTLPLLGFRGYVSENDFSHAVWGWLSCEVILNVPLLFGFALL